MHTINFERGLKLTFQKDAFMFGSRVCRFYFETDKGFVRCDMNNEHCVLRHQFQRGVIKIQ